MKNFTKVLKQHNLKTTPQRLAILEAVYKYGHISIDTLYIEIKKVFNSISQATIYKNINIMINSMLLFEVKLPNEKSVYEIVQNKHSHFLCNCCGEVTDIYIDTKQMIDNISKEYSFTINQTDLVFSGTCKKCKDFNILKN
ncbi:MAG: transcriptional repressor [Arcobacteraceae bacterium]|nr:transcriptional repressor [Arcobacteraceae bacterium]